MESLGEFFRQAREAQGLSLEGVASSTKIQESHLQALEEDYFDQLPQEVFTKGFVRTYAKLLGLDEEEAIRRFIITAGPFYKREKERQVVLTRIDGNPKEKTNRNAFVILAGGIILGILFILPREQSSPPSVTPVDSEEESQNISTAKKGKNTKESFGINGVSSKDGQVKKSARVESKQSKNLSVTRQDKPLTSKNRKPVSPKTSVSAATSVVDLGLTEGRLLLEMQALETTWVVVRSDERAPREVLLHPGQSGRWRADRRFLLTLGNAGGVVVKLNGKPRGPFGKTGMVVRDLEIKP